MKKGGIIFLFSIFSLYAQSQIKISYSAGYADYKMGNMKSILSNIKTDLTNQLPVDIGIIDNFPSYITHNFEVGYKLRKHEFGVNLTYLTTGGKLAYSDYSGEIMFKLILNGYRIGALYRYGFMEMNLGNTCSLSLYGEISPGIAITSLKSKGHIKVGESINESIVDDALKSNSTGFSILPQLGVQINLPYKLGAHVSGGYDFEMGSKLEENKDRRVDWSGIRILGGISYQF